MTKSIESLIERVRDAKRQLIANREADALRIALDTVALIKLRVQNSGKDAQGGAFAAYTPGYAAQRTKAGFQTSFVDFTRKGELWANVQPVVVRSDVFSATVEIGPTDPAEVAKLAGLEKKRPGILVASKEEIEMVRKANRARILKYFNF